MNLIFRFTFALLFLLAASALSSCSVAMAARKEGTSIEKIRCCHTRGQILSQAACVISSERTQDGSLIEVYQFQKERGSAARAFMHGALDVSTLGLWEVVGTPIEACVNERTYFSLRVYYDYCENIRKIELL